MRLIDPIELKRSIAVAILTGNLDEFVTMLDKIIDEQPTIEERKTGKWISLDDFRGKYNDYGYKCSECGEHSDYEENYCPNCGASMMEGE